MVENSAMKTEKPARFYDLSENFQEESVKIIDHGVYNKDSRDEIEKKVYDFYVNYSNYLLANDPGAYVAFVYGDNEKAILGRFDVQNSTVHLFGLVDEENAVSSKTVTIKTPSIQETMEDKVVVDIAGEKREFILKDDEAFYFIIVSKRGEEVFIDEKGQ
jgi:hypothetical protein